MLHFFYRWRYNKAQRSKYSGHAARPRNRFRSKARPGSYISRVSDRDPSESYRTKLWKRRIFFLVLAILIFCFLGWVVVESIEAIQQMDG